MLTRQQVIWAAQHDWFVADNRDGSVDVIERATLDGEPPPAKVETFRDIRELRAWAGY